MKATKSDLTDKQQDTLQFIKDFTARQKTAPTVNEMAEGLKLDSLRSVTQRLEALEKKGYIKRDKFRHRGIVVLQKIDPFIPQGTIRIPVIASAGCDAMQIYAQQNFNEFLTVDEKLILHARDIVAIKALGGSMIDAGINNGDYVLVEVTEDVGDGDRVVAVIGDMAVIKRLKRASNAVILEPESKGNGYSPIIMHEDFKVFGKVLSIIHMSRRADSVEYVFDPGFNRNI